MRRFAFALDGQIFGVIDRKRYTDILTAPMLTITAGNGTTFAF